MNFFDTHITPEARLEVEQCLDSGMLSEGIRVRTFERELEERGYRNAVAVNSGTSALHLALVLAGVHEGDEVILPAQTFVATGLAVLYCGAKPVFADIGTSGNINIEDVKQKVSQKTKAIIAVSWGGNPCNLYDLVRTLPVYVIQDNAQAFGATHQGNLLSEFGELSCYSFQAIKALSTGDGGLISCQKKDDYERAKRLRWFGIDREKDAVDETGERNYNLKEVGFKYHMSDYNAALGLGNLEGFDDRLARVREIANRYNTHLRSLSPLKKDGCSYWLYDLLIDRRSDFMRAMKDRGIPTSVVHVGIDRNEIFGGKQDLPVQRYWDEHHVCIPIHAGLTDEDVERVVEGVLKGW